MFHCDFLNMKFTKSTGNFGLVVLALITAQTGFGLYPVIARKIGVGVRSNPLIFCMARDVCSLPVLFMLGLLSDGWLGIPKWRDCLVFMGLGLFGVFVNQLLYLLSVTYVGANITTIFQQMIPIWTTFLTIITCTEKLPSIRAFATWLKLLGLIFAVLGAVVMTFLQSTGQDDSSTSIGYVLIFFNTIFTSIYYVSQKRFIFDQPNNKWRNHPIWVLTWTYMAGSIFISSASLYYLNTPGAFYLSLEERIALIYAIVITSCLCYVLLTWANSQTSASIVTAFWPFQVVPCFIGSSLVNGEVLNPLQYIGAVLVITGLFSVVFGKLWEERRTRE